MAPLLHVCAIITALLLVLLVHLFTSLPLRKLKACSLQDYSEENDCTYSITSKGNPSFALSPSVFPLPLGWGIHIRVALTTSFSTQCLFHRLNILEPSESFFKQNTPSVLVLAQSSTSEALLRWIC